MEGLSDSLLLVKRGFALPSGCKALLMMSPFGMTGFHSNFCRKYCAICADFFILFAHYKAIEPLIKRGGKISGFPFLWLLLCVQSMPDLIVYFHHSILQALRWQKAKPAPNRLN
jgi:hypothetical protein